MRRDDPFDDFFRELERMMNEFMGVRDQTGFDPGGAADTHVDIHEYDDRITVIADLPGVQKEDINLQCDGRMLSIAAATDTRQYDDRVQLPSRVDEHTARAKYNNGVLEVSFERVDDSADISVD